MSVSLQRNNESLSEKSDPTPLTVGSETLQRFKHLLVCQSSLWRRQETSTSPHRKQTSQRVHLCTLTADFLENTRNDFLITAKKERNKT